VYCEICGRDSMWKCVEVKDGGICEECFNRIPDVLEFDRKKVSKPDIIGIIRTFDKHGTDKTDKFRATGGYGLMEVDEPNGYVRIKRSFLEQLDDSTVEAVCFDMADVRGVDVYCTDVRKLFGKHVSCSICVTFKFTGGFRLTKKIKKHKRCYSSVKSGNMEPAELNLLKDLLNRMYRKTVMKYRISENSEQTYRETEFMKACALFMVFDTDELNMRDIENRKIRLKTIFCESREKETIDRYYTILKNHIEAADIIGEEYSDILDADGT